MTHLPDLHHLLAALGEVLAADQGPVIDMVVCGGSAMNFHGLVNRPTRDVDVVAIWHEGGSPPWGTADPLPDALLVAVAQLADAFRLPKDWLNPGPTALLRWGLPPGWEGRLVVHDVPPRLRVRFLAREDLIGLKLYAFADTGSRRHREDLQAIKPTPEEWVLAVDWVLTHDDSEAFVYLLRKALVVLGAHDAAEGLS